jgi:hypothetical protein
VGNTTIPDSARPQMAKVSGVHQRSAHGHVMSITYDIMSAARENLSRSDLKAMNRTLELLGPDTAEHFGNMLLMHLTALGAMHASISTRLQDAPNDATLIRCRQRIEDSIVTIGIKAGRCKTVADGGYHGDKRSLRLTDAMKVARQRMVECASNGKGEELLEGIAAAVLPGPLLDSISERQQNPGAFVNGDRSVSPMQVLQKKLCDDLEKVLQAHLDIGGAEHLIVAILDLLKLPEYVLQGAPGSTGDKPDAPVRDDMPVDPPKWVGERAATGAPFLYNNTPVKVENYIDLADLVKALGDRELPFTHVHNFVDEMRRDAYSLGRAEARCEMLTDENSLLKEHIRLQDRKIADLEERLLKQNTLLQAWANGQGLTRTSDRLSKDQGTDALRYSDANTFTEGLDPLTRHDDGAPRRPDGLQRTRVERQENRQDTRQLHHASSAALPPDGDLRGLRSSDVQRAEQLLVSAHDNGNGGPRNNNLPPEDEVDNTSRPINRASTAKLPDDEVANKLNQNKQDLHQRLGSTEQRLGGQRDEQNRQLQRDTLVNRSGNRQASPEVDGVYQEYTHYLQAQGIDVGPLAPDPFRPTSTRFMLASRPWDPVKGAPRHRQLLPSDVASYVRERSANAGTPFVPSMTGKVGPAPQQQKTVLQQAFDDFFEKSRLIPRQVARASEPAAQQIPLLNVADVGRLSRSPSVTSLASTNSSSSGGEFEYGELIREGSKQSSARLPLRNAQAEVASRISPASALAQLARSIPSVPIVDVKPPGRVGLSSDRRPVDKQNHDALRQSIIFGAHTPRGEDMRQVTYSEPHDPLAALNVDEVLESIREEDQQPSTVAAAVPSVDPLGLLDREYSAEWSPLTTPVRSTASSVAGEEPEDVGEFEPDRDNMVLKRSHSAFSVDSGRGSPPVQSEEASWEPQPVDRVADRVTAIPKRSDVKDQQARLIEELSERLRQRAS